MLDKELTCSDKRNCMQSPWLLKKKKITASHIMQIWHFKILKHFLKLTQMFSRNTVSRGYIPYLHGDRSCRIWDPLGPHPMNLFIWLFIGILYNILNSQPVIKGMFPWAVIANYQAWRMEYGLSQFITGWWEIRWQPKTCTCIQSAVCPPWPLTFGVGINSR